MAPGSDDSSQSAGRPPRSMARMAVLAVSAALLFALFIALGNWQIQRRAWKQELITQVDARVLAKAVPAPTPAQWANVNAATDAYRRVRLQGAFQHDRETLVQASTRLGAGFWVVTPLRQADGSIVLVNRGFVPPEARLAQTRAANTSAGTTTVEGLLRMSEPGGGFLRSNDPVADRWFSRDVAAIAAARGLPPAQVAPFFVDADAPPGAAPGTWPAGGLTVVQFPNNHLPYAITWFTLALMVVAGAVVVARSEHRRRPEPRD